MVPRNVGAMEKMTSVWIFRNLAENDEMLAASFSLVCQSGETISSIRDFR